MKNITWDGSLSVDGGEIDEQHKMLVDLFNLLSRSVSDGDGADYVEAVLEELISGTIWHFRHEERLMLESKYDDLDAHRAEHNELINGVKALQVNFHKAKKLLTEKDIAYLEDWLTGHILGRDMRLGFHLMNL